MHDDESGIFFNDAALICLFYLMMTMERGDRARSLAPVEYKSNSIMIIRRSNIWFIAAALVASILISTNYYVSAFSSPSSKSCNSSRREIINIFTKATVGAVLIGTSTESNALDMDSFENSLIEKDTTECNSKDPKCIPKLTADEALCKYGVSGADERTKACRRVRDAGGQLPGSKKGERSTQGWLNGDIALTAN